MEVNCNDGVNATVKGIPWKVLFPMGLWHLWIHRNNFLFRTRTMDARVRRKCIQGSFEFFSIGFVTKTKQLKTIVPRMGEATEGLDKAQY